MDKEKQKKWEDTRIYDLQSYLKWLEKVIITTNDGDGQKVELETSHIYYRGQADRSWPIKPSVFRKQYDESSLLREAQRQCWSKLCGLKSWTEKLILLQHYGLPTRLLDVTFNPLVALYFACCSHKDKIGAVYCGYDVEPSCATGIAESISYLICNKPYSSELSSNSDYFDTNDKRYHEPNFLYAPFNSDRITAQNGAFIIAPLERIESTHPAEMLLDKCFDNRRAVICPKRKDEILRQLSIIGINRGSLFVTLEDKLASIAENELLNSLTNKYNLQ